jgi:hypothetical protein
MPPYNEIAGEVRVFRDWAFGIQNAVETAFEGCRNPRNENGKLTVAFVHLLIWDHV